MANLDIPGQGIEQVANEKAPEVSLRGFVSHQRQA